MDPAQVRFRFEAVVGDNNHIQIKVKTIRWPDEETTYVFPTELQDSLCHEQLLEITSVKRACKSLLKEGQFRNITITLPGTLTPLYLDDDRNFVFNDTYLESSSQLLSSEIPNSSNYDPMQILFVLLGC